jgi:hypothetical protein
MREAHTSLKKDLNDGSITGVVAACPQQTAIFVL